MQNEIAAGLVHMHELGGAIEATNIGLKLAVVDANDAKRLVRWGPNNVVYVPERT